jgi:histidinol-phosphatase (PHP family)
LTAEGGSLAAARERGIDQARDLPLDSHLHTDQSPDSDVPIDVYAAEALERGIDEIAITDHVDFDRRDPAWNFVSFSARERVVRNAAARWADRGVAIRFGVELTYNRRWEADVREHLARHRYDFTIGSVHDWPGSPYRYPRRLGAWLDGRSMVDSVRPYFEEIVAAARSGLFDTIGHLDVVRRYLAGHVPTTSLALPMEAYEPVLRTLVETGTALEINTSGLRHAVADTYPPAAVVAAYRALGGRRVTAGSDAHRADCFAFGLAEGYRTAAEAGFAALHFRRGRDAVEVEIPRGDRRWS